jgi:hypothetical protein
MLAIACGEYKPKRGEHQIWFTSIKSVAAMRTELCFISNLQTVNHYSPNGRFMARIGPYHDLIWHCLSDQAWTFTSFGTSKNSDFAQFQGAETG